ncbi:relaxase/mobilization nuclease domain-containing protein [uncultured Polaribacter sp.]|uniref:relaxase/mobilization nuclease domain-containing protein n=1 Tax=uncultured Polaribacter sp. TaxID=174711 RepID=UPI00260E78B5|nr:relaxase/mobilization nuclease domain-containing protein [uncultured Polaribacter sp.]
MITKLESISYLQNALGYCERGGELIISNKCIGNSFQINSQMEQNNALNDRCIKNTFHIKIRIAPEDKGKLNTQDWIDISHDYAKKIGFQNNPFAVYIHEEKTENEHIHIVASRIKYNNLAVSDSYTHYQNMDFCRDIEKKYKLRQVKRVLETVKKQEIFTKNDKRIAPLEEKIASAINQSDSFKDFEFHLKNMGIKTKKGRGIGFIDEKGVYIKGSAINRRYSLKGIEKLLSYEQQEKQMNKKNRGFKI